MILLLKISYGRADQIIFMQSTYENIRQLEMFGLELFYLLN